MRRKFEKRKDRGDRPERPDRGDRFPVRKGCRFCKDKSLTLDCKDGRALKPFLTEHDKISPRRQTGLCAKHQRELTRVVKRARVLSLIPYTSSQRDLF